MDDAQVEIWRERGLIDFPLDSPLNTIHLCPDCEAQFDMPGGGFGFILIPEDMYFFTRYEVEDDYRRTRIIDTPGTDILPPRRPPPTAELYRAHQNGVVGGRYRRVFLNGSPSYAQEEDISTPKEWSGAPIAALRRAMQVFGTLYMIEIGNEAHYTLGWLRGLYAYNDKNLREYLSICQVERYKI